MGSKAELKEYFVSGGKTLDPNAIADKYSSMLPDKESKDLFAAATRLFVVLAQGGISPNRMLDHLATGDSLIRFRLMKELIRERGQSINDILDAYDAYFDHGEKKDFWPFFNKELGLPSDWRDKARKKIKPKTKKKLDRNEEIVGKESWREWKCPKALYDVMEKFQEEAYRVLETYQQMWYSKGVYMEFKYKGKQYSIYPGTLNIPIELLEILEDGFEQELNELGCTDIHSYGDID